MLILSSYIIPPLFHCTLSLPSLSVALHEDVIQQPGTTRNLGVHLKQQSNFTGHRNNVETLGVSPPFLCTLTLTWLGWVGNVHYTKQAQVVIEV